MEFVNGIVLDQKFLRRCVRAAFVNTKWYETWSERALFVDPIINDVWDLRLLSLFHDENCDCTRIQHCRFQFS